VALKLNRDLAYLGELCATRQVVPVVDGPYPLAAAADAFRRFAAGAQLGKIVLRVADATD
jgi:NADPH:quinone reductase-like Zn-dependent oxidoreductase